MRSTPYELVIPQSIEIQPITVSTADSNAGTGPVGLPETLDFGEWLKTFSKSYATEAEQARRAEIFAAAVAMIQQHNAEAVRRCALTAKLTCNFAIPCDQRDC